MIDGWYEPTSDEVHTTVAALVDPHLRRLFFDGLKNPLWVEPLDELGMFTPKRRVRPEGGTAPVPWPEGEYLARVAGDVPGTVTRIFLNHRASDNPWVQRVVVDAAVKMSPVEIAQLAPAITSFVRRGSARLDPRLLLRLVEVLREGGFPSEGKELLGALFEPKKAGQRGRRLEVAGAIDGYWYAELLPRAVPLLVGLGVEGLELVIGWLAKAVRLAGKRGDLAHRSIAVWRPSIASSSQNSRLHEIGDALIDAARDVGVGLGIGGQAGEVIDRVISKLGHLGKRIALEVLAQTLGRAPSEGPVAMAAELLLDLDVLDLWARPDYIRLATIALPKLDADQLAAWLAVVRDQQWQGPEDLIRRIAARSYAEEADVTAEKMAATRRRMLYKLLLPLRAVLPSTLSDEFQALATEFGSIEHPEFVSYPEGWTGPNSPATAADLAAMEPRALAEFLRNWAPSAERWGPEPSVEGLSRVLEEVATSHPENLEAIAAHLPEFGLSYVRAAFAGWANAGASGYEPGDAVWQLAETVSAAQDDGANPAAGCDDHDIVWRYSQQRVISFVEAVVKRKETAFDFARARQMWAILHPLTTHPDPVPEDEDRDNMDPLSFSLSTTRPAALRATISLLARISSDLDDAEIGDLKIEITAALDAHLGPDLDPSLATAGVFGEGSGKLHSAVPEWLAPRLEEVWGNLVSTDPVARSWADVMFSVAVRMYRTGSGFLGLIRPALLLAMSPDYASLQHTEGWRDQRTTIDTAVSHVINAYVINLIGRDDPLVSAVFGSTVPDDIVADALGHLGWVAMRMQEDPDPATRMAASVLGRAKELLDWRANEIRAGRASAAELASFYWWVRADILPAEWWLPMLVLACEHDAFKPQGMIGEKLAEASSSKPELTLEVFDRLMERRDDQGMTSYDLIQNAPRILASALRSTDDVVVTKARSVLDRLARAGHIYLPWQVDDVLHREDADGDT